MYCYHEIFHSNLQIINYEVHGKNEVSKSKFQTFNKQFIFPFTSISLPKEYKHTKLLFEPLYHEDITEERIVIIYSNYHQLYLNVDTHTSKVTDISFRKFIKQNTHILPLKIRNKCPTLMYHKIIIVQGGYYGGYVLLFYRNEKKEEEVKKFKSPLSNNPIVSLAIDNSYIYGITGDTHGIITVYNIIKTDWIFKLYLANHSSEIISLVVNNHLNILVSSSYDGYLNVYTIGKFQFVRSLKLTQIPYASHIFISNCPVPCIVVYNKDSNTMSSYTVNGSEIELSESKIISKNGTIMDEDVKSKGRITSYCYFKNDFFNDYLITGTSKGYVIIYSFPSMKPINEIEVKQNKQIKMLMLNSTMKIIAILEGNEFVILSDHQISMLKFANKLTQIGLSY